MPVPVSVQVTPVGINLAVGNSQLFTAVDNLGRPRTDATWTIGNSSIATITTDASPWLTAVAAGSTTLTATVQGVSAQAEITGLRYPDRTALRTREVRVSWR